MGTPGQRWHQIPRNDKGNIKAGRELGQNFLVDASIARRISELVPEEHLGHLIEIGPGTGILTRELLLRGGKIKAIEIDPFLFDHLNEKFKDHLGRDLDLVKGDVLDLLPDLLERDHFIISNLPYNISSDLVGGILDRVHFKDLGGGPFKGAVIMVQREFGERLMAPPGNRTYGKISVMFQAKMGYLDHFIVGSHSFSPKPKVDGLVMSFWPRSDNGPRPDNEAMFKRIVGVAFLNRRKKLRNSLSPSSLGIDIDQSRLREILVQSGFSDKRPETLSWMDFLELMTLLMKCHR